MKCNVINVTPASFAAAMDKTRALLERKEDREITLSFAGGNYDISTPVILNGATGGKTLRLVGGGRVKPTFSSVKEIPASKFTPVPDKPYYVCQLDKDENGNYPTLRAFYANGSIAHVSRTAEYRSNEIVAEARERASEIRRQAEADAVLERKKAEDEMKHEIADVSAQLTGKLLQREINEEDHRNLIDSFLNDLD